MVAPRIEYIELALSNGAVYNWWNPESDNYGLVQTNWDLSPLNISDVGITLRVIIYNASGEPVSADAQVVRVINNQSRGLYSNFNIELGIGGEFHFQVPLEAWEGLATFNILTHDRFIISSDFEYFDINASNITPPPEPPSSWVYAGLLLLVLAGLVLWSVKK